MKRVWDWLRGRRAAARADVRVVLYTRVGCHLCDDAERELEGLRERYGFAVDQIDVDSHPDLAAAYGDRVPVVVVNGRERFRGRVNPVLFARLMRGEAPHSSSGGSGLV